MRESFIIIKFKKQLKYFLVVEYNPVYTKAVTSRKGRRSDNATAVKNLGKPLVLWIDGFGNQVGTFGKDTREWDLNYVTLTDWQLLMKASNKLKLFNQLYCKRNTGVNYLEGRHNRNSHTAKTFFSGTTPGTNAT